MSGWEPGADLQERAGDVATIVTPRPVVHAGLAGQRSHGLRFVALKCSFAGGRGGGGQQERMHVPMRQRERPQRRSAAAVALPAWNDHLVQRRVPSYRRRQSLYRLTRPENWSNQLLALKLTESLRFSGISSVLALSSSTRSPSELRRQRGLCRAPATAPRTRGPGVITGRDAGVSENRSWKSAFIAPALGPQAGGVLDRTAGQSCVG